MPIALTSDACTQMLAKKTILKGARRDDVPLVVLLPYYLNAGVASQKMCGSITSSTEVGYPNHSGNPSNELTHLGYLSAVQPICF